MMTKEQEGYERFFRLLKRDQEKKYEQYAKTSLNSLFVEGRAYYGNVVGASNNGALILRFATAMQPRLKVPMSMCIVRDKAFEKYGDDLAYWSCTSIEFREDFDAHTSFSDALPIYHLKDRKNVGCGQIRTEMYKAVRKALAGRKDLRFVMLETLPPTEMLTNLAVYIRCHSNDENLTLHPCRTYDEWMPIELRSTDNVAERVMESLEREPVCVLQGPPGTGKSYTLAEIISLVTAKGESVCVATQSNASLISLVSQDTIEPLTRRGIISKTMLTEEEKRKHPFLVPADKSLLVGKGDLLCSTYYTLSRIINKTEYPLYDLIVIEEASQAFLTSIAAFMKLGKKCLIVGDPMQLPPVVDIVNKNDYGGIDIERQSNGMMTFVCSTDVPSFRMTTSYRLTAASASQTKCFYGGNLTSVKAGETLFHVQSGMQPLFPDAGGTIVYETGGGYSGTECSAEALDLMHKIVDVFQSYYPKRRLAMLSPFVLTTKALQKEFCRDNQKLDLLVDTINRIQGETVDYTIYYVPLRNYDFAFSENLFNVATSRSTSTTLLITEMPISAIPIRSTKVRQFLAECRIINKDMLERVPHKKMGDSREDVKSYYPGLESIVDLLLDNDVEFSLDGNCDLTNEEDIVIASAGMILEKYKLAIDPIDKASEAAFEQAGYRTVSSEEFDIKMIR